MTDPLLFTPGPLTTSASVKAAMQRDLGSRDAEFIKVVAEIRSELLRIAGVSQESRLRSGPDAGQRHVRDRGGALVGHSAGWRLLILANGAYGERMLQIAERLKIDAHIERWPEDQSPDAADCAASYSTDRDSRRMSRSFISKRRPAS